ncbi:hypothetical protein [Paenibacillus sp. URB8-2]|uniref:hypothetical protein n=1 Tax=Paenibacillus sp. URB8-2 TaxID=2741301 RepID=UPI0015C0C6D1|nr:hypothetical protein [Paenibacillus sp. URB8-2]BCG60923.1 hypothetical protein PUR_43480 [Paenibacillus sp. URB8-2]
MNAILAFQVLVAATAVWSDSPGKPLDVSNAIEDLRFLSQLADELLSDQERTIITSVSFEGNGVNALVLQNRASGIEALSEAISWMEDTASDLKRLGHVGFWNIRIEIFIRKKEMEYGFRYTKDYFMFIIEWFGCLGLGIKVSDELPAE